MPPPGTRQPLRPPAFHVKRRIPPTPRPSLHPLAPPIRASHDRAPRRVSDSCRPTQRTTTSSRRLSTQTAPRACTHVLCKTHAWLHEARQDRTRSPRRHGCTSPPVTHGPFPRRQDPGAVAASTSVAISDREHVADTFSSPRLSRRAGDTPRHRAPHDVSLSPLHPGALRHRRTGGGRRSYSADRRPGRDIALPTATSTKRARVRPRGRWSPATRHPFHVKRGAHRARSPTVSVQPRAARVGPSRARKTPRPPARPRQRRCHTARPPRVGHLPRDGARAMTSAPRQRTARRSPGQRHVEPRPHCSAPLRLVPASRA